MKKLKIKFWQIENLVVMKILDQDERLRGKEAIYEDSDLDMTIYSVKVPDMTSKSFFLLEEKEKKKIAWFVMLLLIQPKTPLTM